MPIIKEKNQTSPRKKITMVMAIANNIINSLELKEKINKAVEWNKDHWWISPGGLIKALVLSTFTDIRVPLVHIQERLQDVDLTYLLGEEVEAGRVNSFNVGRALERLGKADYQGIYEGMALAAITQNNIPVERLHSDTTTISFYGEYEEEEIELKPEEKEGVLRIEKGYNKDGRPKSKQMMVGQITTEDGIPLVSREQNGSTSDIEWNKMALAYLERIRKEGFTHGIYVADSKLVTCEFS